MIFWPFRDILGGLTLKFCLIFIFGYLIRAIFRIFRTVYAANQGSRFSLTLFVPGGGHMMPPPSGFLKSVKNWDVIKARFFFATFSYI